MKKKLSLSLLIISSLLLVLAESNIKILGKFDHMRNSLQGLGLLAMLIVVVWNRMQVRTWILSRKVRKGVSSLFFLSSVMIFLIIWAVLSQSPVLNGSFDVTRTQQNTLSDQSKKVISEISDTDIEVIGFFSSELVQSEFEWLLGLFESSGLATRKQFYNPKDEPKLAAKWKVSAANTVIFRNSENRSISLTTFSEQMLTNALLELHRESVKKVLFTIGHGEASIDDPSAVGFSRLTKHLRDSGYVVDSLSMLRDKQIPDETGLIVIAGPEYELMDEEIAVLEKYLRSGGAVLTMVAALKPVRRLNGLMRKFGMEYSRDLVLLPSSDKRREFFGAYSSIVDQVDGSHPMTYVFREIGNVQLVVQNGRSIVPVTAESLATEPETLASFAKDLTKITDVESLSELGEVTDKQIEISSALPFLVLSETKIKSGQESKLVAMGSVSLAQNQGFSSSQSRDFILNSFHYLLRDERLVSIRPRSRSSSVVNLGTQSAIFWLNAIAYVFPFLFLALGLIGWNRRRRG